MELHYWEKQLILYTKGHFERIDIDEDLKKFPARYYGFGVDQVDSMDILHMVTDLYTKLYENGLLQFKLNAFITEVFKRNRFSANSDSVTRMDILKQMLSEIQRMKVLGVIELGEADKEMYEEITKSISKVGRSMKYIGGMDIHDGLTNNQNYLVVNETTSQLIVKNDLGGISGIQKSKFVEVD